MVTPSRALPLPTPDSKDFWRGCNDGELRMQQCDSCGTVVWFPRGLCAVCNSASLTWFGLSGHGTLYSFSVVTRPANPAFQPQYILALVDLEEGPRMMTHLIDVNPEAVEVGMAVHVQFERQTPEICLPVFTPRRADTQ